MNRPTTALMVMAMLAGTGRAHADAGAPVPRAAKAAADRLIRDIATAAHGGEYPDHRAWLVGDLNADGRPDAAILFTVEIGNNYTTFLMVLLAQPDGGFETIGPEWAGGRGKRFVSFGSITPNKIELRTKTFDPKTDAMCCPSVEGRTTFALHDEQLREEPPGKPARPGD